MKKNAPSKFIILQNNSISNLKSFTSTIKKATFLFVFSLFYTTISAQNENSTTPVVTEVKSYISSLKNAEKNLNLSFSNAKNVEDLVTNIQSSIYFNAGEVKSYGENPKNLYTDISSLRNLGNANISRNNIEMIILNIDDSNDLNAKIDLNLFSDFHKLKYIYLKSSVTSSERDFVKMFTNYDEQYAIFYKNNKGE